MGQGIPDLTSYVKTDDLANYVKTNDLANYVKTTSLEDYAKKTALDDYIKTVDIPSNIPLRDNVKKAIGSDTDFQAAVRNLLVSDPTFNTNITKFISDNSDKFRGQPGIIQFSDLNVSQKAEIITNLYNANKISFVDEITGRDNFKSDIINALAQMESLRGPKGETGTMGPIGLTGPQGLQGLQGLQGETGTMGPIGLTGPQGIQGIKGDKGDKGETGSDYKDTNAISWFKERVMWCADGNICNIPANKNVGIGTTSPLQKLHVQGNITVPAGNGIQFSSDSGSPAGSGLGNYSILSTTTSPFALRLVGTVDSANRRPFEIGYYTGDDINKAWNPKFSVNTYTGNVGVGTANPITTLHVNKSGGNNYIRISGDTGAQQALEFFDSQQNAQRWVVYKPGNTTDLNFWNPSKGNVLQIQANGDTNIDGNLNTTGDIKNGNRYLRISGGGANCREMQSSLSKPGDLIFAGDVEDPLGGRFWVAGMNANGSTYCRKI